MYSVRLVLIATALIVLPAIAFSQATVRVEGNIRDEITGKPVGCKIDITNAEGKRILNVSSNETDGSYLFVVNEAGTMKLTFRGYNVMRKDATIEIPKTERFKEIRQDFIVRALARGTQLSNVRGFERNLDHLSSVGRKTLDDLKSVLRENGEMRVEIVVVPDEDQLVAVRQAAATAHTKELAAWNKAKKKLKKGQVAPPEPQVPAEGADPNELLIRARIEAVKRALQDVKNGDLRVVVTGEPLPAAAVAKVQVPQQVQVAATKGKKGKAPAAKAAAPAQAATEATNHGTLIVTIGKVKKLFD